MNDLRDSRGIVRCRGLRARFARSLFDDRIGERNRGRNRSLTRAQSFNTLIVVSLRGQMTNGTALPRGRTISFYFLRDSSSRDRPIFISFLRAPLWSFPLRDAELAEVLESPRAAKPQRQQRQRHSACPPPCPPPVPPSPGKTHA